MKKYFITGLVLLLPLALTAAIILFIINIFTDPFVGVVSGFFDRYGLLQRGFLFLSPEDLQLYVSKLLILFLLFFFTVFLGWLTRWMIVHYFIRVGDYIFHRIPFVRTIYKTSQDVIKTIFGSTANSFKQVVLVPFPNKDTIAVGLITKDDVPAITKEGNKLVAVFVPTTPNPTSGFLMMYEKEDLIFLDISIEEAFKYIISCGVISPPFMNITSAKPDSTND